MRYRINAQRDSDVGDKRRERGEENEDSFCVGKDIGVFIVADGVGGHQKGEMASAKATEYVIKKLEGHIKESFWDWLIRRVRCKDKYEGIEGKIKEAMKGANAELYMMNGGGKGESDDLRRYMCTTMSVVVLTDKKVYMAYVGNSRIYWREDGKIRKNKIDAEESPVISKIDELLYSQEINEEQRKRALKMYISNPYKNIIKRALGFQNDIEPTVASYPIDNISHILLCTDGLTDNATDDEIDEILRGDSPEKVVKKLIKLANNPQEIARMVDEMCSEKGADEEYKERIRMGYKGNDNITVIAIRLEKDRWRF